MKTQPSFCIVALAVVATLAASTIEAASDKKTKVSALEFKVLGNEIDDAKAIQEARDYINSIDNKEELRRLQERGELPPGPRSGDRRAPKRFLLDLAHDQQCEVTYGWVELGPQEMRDFGLDNESRNSSDTRKKQIWDYVHSKLGEAVQIPEPTSIEKRFLLRGALFYGRECKDRNLPEKERLRKQYEYFVLARNPEIDRATGKETPKIDESFVTEATSESSEGRFTVKFVLNEKGGELFRRLTSANTPSGATAEESQTKRHLAIVLNGKVMSAPTINSVIGSHGQISGSFTKREADALVRILREHAAPAALETDSSLQGEYVGKIASGTLGCQVIALGKGNFQAVLMPGGLPGAGWDGKDRMLMDGKLDGGKVVFVPTAGKRKYMAVAPQEFSATAKFPPQGQKDCTATLVDGTLTGKTSDGQAFTLKKTERKSPTLGTASPAGAIVLFDGKNADEWKEGKIVDGLLPVPATSKRTFKDFKLHLEFRTPFQPAARSQQRGNSGVYLHGKREIQVLDSFGLEGKDNECGGFYQRRRPDVNMCLPPLAWQTYDVEFTSEPVDPSSKKQMARVTVFHNGVKIHDNVGFPSEQGPLHLQNHGNAVFYRNIWIVTK